ncbi:phage tail protein [Bittarella massiliensis (ex Durand et al. 2017)]|uniref:phage tail protein n=1 Tax=Bittarella massiliensis (ex Durand et al. 2017) TaxID=1720313 RepID=UPI001AA195AE|nr:hypothetical protein [Bittarella massiliensis (ex Durand et al. 2017)]MBO1680181.1 hypothetical protein [Bittarella massiliensis (ex Durand et al. 2017)]
MDLLDIYAKMTIDTSKYTENLSKAEREAKKFAEQSARDNRKYEEQRARDSRKYAEQKARDAKRYEEQRARDKARFEQQQARDERRYAEQRARDAERMAQQKARAEQREAEKAAKEQQRIRKQLEKDEAASHQKRIDMVQKGGVKALDVVKGIVKAATAVVTITATGITAVAKSSVDAYGEAEQLVGGVEKLFGGSAAIVKAYADNAFKSAQMSSNEYMQIATSFSASLMQALGNDSAAAAEMVNVAINDMADNWNTYGTRAEDVKNAYQGFAKQNYTMLDNLKLGYGGTAAEMARLINDAGLLGRTVDESLEGVTFADIIMAIHKVQENLKLTGTSSKEAASTVQGSIATMKAAWQNFLVALADPNADFDKVTDNLVTSIDAVLDKVGPILVRVFDRLGDAFEERGPEILDMLGSMLEDIMPGLMGAVQSLLLAICEFITSGDNIQQIANVVRVICDTIVFLLQNDEIKAAIVMVVREIGGVMLAAAWEGFVALSETLVEGVLEIASRLVVGLSYGLWLVIYGIGSILGEVGKTIWKGLSGAWESVTDFFAKVGSGLANVGKNIIKGFADGIMAGAGFLYDVLNTLSFGLLDKVCDFFDINSPSRVMRVQGRFITEGLALGIEDEGDNAERSVRDISQRIRGGFSSETVGYGDSAAGGLHNAIASQSRGDGDGTPTTIIVQSVLDGRVIGETAYNYNRRIGRALGV